MQVSSVVPIHQNFNSCSDFKEISAKFEDDFTSKLTLNELESFNNKKPPPSPEEEAQEDEEEEEFSFACTNPDGSPISADDVFLNGQIRPVFPLFNRDLLFSGDDEPKTSSSFSSSSSPALRPPLKKLFVKERDDIASSSEAEEPEGPHCAWTGKAVETSPEVCKKSNSTGFSKLRRFRELVLRSNSDGKDVFVFLHHHNTNHDNDNANANANSKAEKSEKVEEKKKKKVAVTKGKKSETALSSSAHERLYVRNRAIKEEHKRKSYLPYRVGFFTNVNGLSSNVHPY